MSREFDTVTQRKGSHRGPGRDTTSSKAIAVVERHAQWVKDRLAHMTYRAIAERDGVDPSTVHEAVSRAMARTVEEPTKEMIALELEQLGELIRAVWSDALLGEPDKVEAARKLMADRRKMLGLDAPLQVNARVEHETVDLDELRALLRPLGWDIVPLVETTGEERP